jgi:hypothetical protein
MATLSDLNVMNNPGIGKLVCSQEMLLSAMSNADNEITRERYQHFVMMVAGYTELDDADWQWECTNLEVPHELAARECMDQASFLKLYTESGRDILADGSAFRVAEAPGVVALCDILKGASISKLNLSSCQIETKGLSMLEDAISDMAATLNQLIVSSTGSKKIPNRGHNKNESDASGPRTYTLKGLQGGADPILDLSSKFFLGPADLQFLSMVFTYFKEFTPAIRELNVVVNPGIDAEHNLDLFEQICWVLLKIDPARLQISGIGIGPNALKRLFSLFTNDSKLTAAIRALNVMNNPGIDAEHNLDLFEQICRMLLKINPARLQISGIGIGPNALKRRIRYRLQWFITSVRGNTIVSSLKARYQQLQSRPYCNKYVCKIHH